MLTILLSERIPERSDSSGHETSAKREFGAN